jgi:hypothetical protein
MVAEAGDSSGFQRKEYFRRYQKTGEDTAGSEDLNVCSSELQSVNKP